MIWNVKILLAKIREAKLRIKRFPTRKVCQQKSGHMPRNGYFPELLDKVI
jgi:hypothetical protein